ncbi:replication factor C small subunit [Candidatus Woesearchaeota archaeon]|jgi:replication factor C small subunit|nr:replication factor C small subunit [Candidatus Woesearchaeota archaeon]|tara:strand:- start:482 stop:1435 length:954 start_codon:yes stop_codon:yes gene_type:complete
MNIAIWTEKYRPKKFHEIKGQEAVVNRAEAFVKQKNMPHLLFAGPAGTGKTSLSLVIAKNLFKDSWYENFLELNASDERGIDVIRVKVKDFARTRAIGDVPFKIIYLDECDALTKEAQQALRRTMENYTQTCRFILSCNYSSKIIDPIQSRCSVFRFKPLPKKSVFSIIDTIAKNESLKIDENAKEALYNISEGDCRRVENILQASAVINKNISESMIYELASIAKPKEVKNILSFCIQKDFLKAKNELLKTMLENGLSGLDMIKQIQKEIWGLDIDDKKKLSMTKECGEVEFRMVEGSDEFIQLESLISKFVLINN